jgi:Tol biopolymer transport system component
MRTLLRIVALVLSATTVTSPLFAQLGQEASLTLICPTLRSGIAQFSLLKAQDKQLNSLPITLPFGWVALSPDGKKIVFTSSDANGDGLFVMDANGGNVKRLTTGHDIESAWSRDGKKIAFARFKDDHSEICVVTLVEANGEIDPAASQQTIQRLIGGGIVRANENGPPSPVEAAAPPPDVDAGLPPGETWSLDYGQPAWSPDGTKIAFAYNQHGTGKHLYIMDANGQNVRDISGTDNDQGFVYPAWSPDGKRIVYTDIGPDGVGLLFCINADGTNKIRLPQPVDQVEVNTYPAWSPDGRKIAYVSITGVQGTLYVMNDDGSGAKALLKNEVVHECRPAWGPMANTLPLARITTNRSTRPVPPPVGPSTPGGTVTSNVGSTELPPPKVIAEKSAMIAANTGGTVELPDGTGIEIPAGALPADTKVTVRRFTSPPLPQDSAAAVVEVDIGGVKLNQEATIRLPLLPELQRGQAAAPIKVYRVHDGQIVEMPARVDSQGKFVEVRTRECSVFAWGLGAVFAAVVWWFHLPALTGISESQFVDYLQTLPRTNYSVSVPYYTQDKSDWCWAAAHEMMFKAFPLPDGKTRPINIWDLARRQGSRFNQGLSFLGNSDVEKMYVEQGLPIQYFASPWKNHWALCHYMITQLKDGHPVLIDMKSAKHAAVAVGFDAAGLRIHDPLTGEVDASISWSNFVRRCQSEVGNQVYTFAITGPRVADVTASVQLCSNGLAFRHPKPAPHTEDWDVWFVWDGQVGSGYRFCFGCPDVGHLKSDDSEVSFIKPLHATKSDLCKLDLEVSNTGPSEQVVTVSVFLAGLPLGAPVTERVPPKTGKKPIRIDWTPIAASFQPAEHELKIQATVDGRLVDEFAIKVGVGPSQVKNLRSETEGGRTYLRWDPVPEAGTVYDVYFVQRMSRAGRSELVPALRATMNDTRWPMEETDIQVKGETWHYVVARHNASNLTSSPSDFLGRANKYVVAEGKMSISVGDFANEQNVNPGSSFAWAATGDNTALLEWSVPAGMENNFKALLGSDKVVPIPATKTNSGEYSLNFQAIQEKLNAAFSQASAEANAISAGVLPGVTALQGMRGTVRPEGANIRVEFQATLIAGDVRADYKLNVLAKPPESPPQ